MAADVQGGPREVGQAGVGVVAAIGDGLMHTGMKGGGGGGGVDAAMIYSLNSPSRSPCLFADPQ